MVTTPIATDTHCTHRDTPRSKPCRGDLVRPDDGADRMSEHMGRIILLCLKCGQRWSCSISEGKYKRKE